MTMFQKSARSGATREGAAGAAKPNELWETIRTVGAALLIALVIKTVLFQPFTIPSASEEPNLYEGDYIIVSKWPYGYSHHSILFSPPLFQGRIFSHAPRRGDVIVFKLPSSGHIDYIKRLVGLPGDRLQVRQGQLYINGKALAQNRERTVDVDDRGGPETAGWVRETNPEGRTYLTQIHGAGAEAADNTGVYVVPQKCYFMMGDNRENSLDSRFDPGIPPEDPKLGGCGWDSRVDAFLPPEAGVGFVPEANLVGRAEIVLLSWKKGSNILKPWTWLNLRADRFLRRIG
jgi:signal peptidase I